MYNIKDLPYTGSILTSMVKDHRYKIDESRFKGQINNQDQDAREDIPPYFPTEELKNSIQYARILRRPLLLRGEPGCGKTRVAQALAYELYHSSSDKNYRDHYFEWFIKSTTKAKEGLYQFDHLARLRDVQAGEEKEITSYRTFGPLGKAFLSSTPESPAVLLIDEIDKADLDFPNDLLLELEESRFFIEETQEEIKAQYPPIVIITSNDEKELPNAFLRRCVFHFIRFPNDDQLEKIVKARITPQIEEFKSKLPEEFIKKIVNRFRELYDSMKSNPNTDKLVSTSELLDWVRIIHFYWTEQALRETSDSTKIEEKLHGELKHLYPEVLLKSLDDYNQQVNKK